jgi:hypothetical protein
MAKLILKSLTLVDFSADVPVSTFVGKKDIIKRKLKDSFSYEDILESLEERGIPEPKTIEELVPHFSDTSSNLFLVLEEHEVYT